MIDINVIPHSEQRLDGNIGDYWYDPYGNLVIRVSKLGTDKKAWLYERLVAIHELCEQTMTEYLGIPEGKIQAFDDLYYWEEDHGTPHSTSEAGWDLRSPYRTEHGISENIERQIALHCGVVWEEYEQAIKALYEHE
jgi:hypothetical protein